MKNEILKKEIKENYKIYAYGDIPQHIGENITGKDLFGIALLPKTEIEKWDWIFIQQKDKKYELNLNGRKILVKGTKIEKLFDKELDTDPFKIVMNDREI